MKHVFILVFTLIFCNSSRTLQARTQNNLSKPKMGHDIKKIQQKRRERNQVEGAINKLFEQEIKDIADKLSKITQSKEVQSKIQQLQQQRDRQARKRGRYRPSRRRYTPYRSPSSSAGRPRRMPRWGSPFQRPTTPWGTSQRDWGSSFSSPSSSKRTAPGLKMGSSPFGTKKTSASDKSDSQKTRSYGVPSKTRKAQEEKAAVAKAKKTGRMALDRVKTAMGKQIDNIKKKIDFSPTTVSKNIEEMNKAFKQSNTPSKVVKQIKKEKKMGNAYTKFLTPLLHHIAAKNTPYNDAEISPIMKEIIEELGQEKIDKQAAVVVGKEIVAHKETLEKIKKHVTSLGIKKLIVEFEEKDEKDDAAQKNLRLAQLKLGEAQREITNNLAKIEVMPANFNKFAPPAKNTPKFKKLKQELKSYKIDIEIMWRKIKSSLNKAK